MTESIICNLCESPGKIDDYTTEIAKIKCNVRAYSNNIFTYWRCSKCKSLHCSEDINLQLYYKNYPMKSQSLDFWTTRAYSNLLKRLTLAGFNKKMSFLDYGCGRGLFLHYLSKNRFSNIAGYDPYIESFSDKNILLQKYDFVFSQDAIEHDKEPIDFFKKLSTLVNTGGIIAIGTPNASQINLKKSALFSMSIHSPYHRHILSKDALVKIAENQGFNLFTSYSRFYYDTLWPTVNYQFLRRYVFLKGNVLDAAFEPAQPSLVIFSPKLWFFALFGYFFPPRSEMMLLFKKK